MDSDSDDSLMGKIIESLSVEVRGNEIYRYNNKETCTWKEFIKEPCPQCDFCNIKFIGYQQLDCKCYETIQEYLLKYFYKDLTDVILNILF